MYIFSHNLPFYLDLNQASVKAFFKKIEFSLFEDGVKFRSSLKPAQFKKYKVIGKNKNMMAEYLENTIFQKLSDFPFDLSVGAKLSVEDKRKKERQKYPVHKNMTITKMSRLVLTALWRS